MSMKIIVLSIFFIMFILTHNISFVSADYVVLPETCRYNLANPGSFIKNWYGQYDQVFQTSGMIGFADETQEMNISIDSLQFWGAENSISQIYLDISNSTYTFQDRPYFNDGLGYPNLNETYNQNWINIEPIYNSWGCPAYDININYIDVSSIPWNISISLKAYSYINMSPFPVPTSYPTPSPTPSPSPTTPPAFNDTNGTGFTPDSSGSESFASYADGIITNISDGTQLMFSLISYPISVLNYSISSINSSLNHSSYAVSMSFLLEVIPAFDNALPNKFKAVITYGLVLMAILINLGRE